MGKLKRVLCGILILIMVVGCFHVQPVEAKTVYTKKQMQAKVKTAKKEVTAAEKQYKAEKKKYDKETKGLTSIWGEIKCSNPFVVNSYGTYYWVTNPKSLTTFLNIASGHVKPTGQYRTWNGITCAVAKAKKVKANPTKYKENYDKKKKKLQEYQNALKEQIRFYDGNSVTVDKTYKLGWLWAYGGKYNNAKFTSSNPNVIKVNNKKTGDIKVMGEGKATITATASCSGKKSKIVITVVKSQDTEEPEEPVKPSEDPSKGNITYLEFDNGVYYGCVLVLYYKTDSDYLPAENDPVFVSDNPNIADILIVEKDEGVCAVGLALYSEGTVTITAKSAGGILESITLHVIEDDGGLYACVY